MSADPAAKFNDTRAAEYARQARIALAGYDACHELSACMLSAALGAGASARILVVGAGGTGGEIVCAADLEPNWSFTAVDPSPPMLALAVATLEARPNLAGRFKTVLGDMGSIADQAVFDAAIMIGVLHHLPGDDAKRNILGMLARRLKAGAPFVLAGNCRPYSSEPLLMAAWANRWRMHGAPADEVRSKMGKILEGAEPPASEDAIAALLDETGFSEPLRFFASLFWGAWLCRRR